MKRLLKLFVLVAFILLSNCKGKTKAQNKVQEIKAKTEEPTGTNVTYKQEGLIKDEETIESFLKKLKSAIKTSDIDFIENSILFPFEHKSGGELVDTYDNYQAIKAGSNKFNTIIKAKYSKGCDNEIDEIKYYCINYFDDITDITFYVVKKNDGFKLVRMETPN